MDKLIFERIKELKEFKASRNTSAPLDKLLIKISTDVSRIKNLGNLLEYLRLIVEFHSGMIGIEATTIKILTKNYADSIKQLIAMKFPVKYMKYVGFVPEDDEDNFILKYAMGFTEFNIYVNKGLIEGNKELRAKFTSNVARIMYRAGTIDMKLREKCYAGEIDIKRLSEIIQMDDHIQEISSYLIKRMRKIGDDFWIKL